MLPYIAYMDPMGISMGDLQDPIDGGTLVPYKIFFRPYELWGYSLKFRPEK